MFVKNAGLSGTGFLVAVVKALEDVVTKDKMIYAVIVIHPESLNKKRKIYLQKCKKGQRFNKAIWSP